MKKKGLIISTVVMVVVLIAALTTTTFAWFTATTKNSIDPINVEVKSNTTVLFGVHKNGYKGDETSSDACVSGTVEFTKKTDGKADGTWEGNPNLGNLILTSVFTGNMTLTKSVGTADLKSVAPNLFDGDPDTSFNTAHSIIKAEGTSDTEITQGTAEYAIENTDYIHLPLGIVLVDSSKTFLKCKITLKLNDENKNIGLAAGLRVIYQVGTSGYKDDKPFFADTHKSDTSKATAGYNELNGISVEIDLAAETETLQNLDLFIILAGYDSDTTTAAASFGLNATITIEFVTDEE